MAFRIQAPRDSLSNRNRNRDCGGGRYVGYRNHNEGSDVEAVRSGEDMNFYVLTVLHWGLPEIEVRKE